MKPVQIVMEESLLRAVDRAARKAKKNRSAYFREAIREHMKRQRILDLEERHRSGYERFPPDEFDVWDKVVAWDND